MSLQCFGDSFRNVVPEFDWFVASSGNHDEGGLETDEARRVWTADDRRSLTTK